MSKNDPHILGKERIGKLLLQYSIPAIIGMTITSIYNIIDSINKQCIIVTKDLLEREPVTGKSRLNEQKLQNLKCSVYRIRKVDDFDSNDISTMFFLNKSKLFICKLKDLVCL